MADDEEMEGPVAAQAERELDEETRLASKATTVPEVGEDGGTASGAADDAGGEASIEHAREASDSSGQTAVDEVLPSSEAAEPEEAKNGKKQKDVTSAPTPSASPAVAGPRKPTGTAATPTVRRPSNQKIAGANGTASKDTSELRSSPKALKSTSTTAAGRTPFRPGVPRTAPGKAPPGTVTSASFARETSAGPTSAKPANAVVPAVRPAITRPSFGPATNRPSVGKAGVSTSSGSVPIAKPRAVSTSLASLGPPTSPSASNSGKPATTTSIRPSIFSATRTPANRNPQTEKAPAAATSRPSAVHGTLAISTSSSRSGPSKGARGTLARSAGPSNKPVTTAHEDPKQATIAKLQLQVTELEEKCSASSGVAADLARLTTDHTALLIELDTARASLKLVEANSQSLEKRIRDIEEEKESYARRIQELTEQLEEKSRRDLEAAGEELREARHALKEAKNDHTRTLADVEKRHDLERKQHEDDLEKSHREALEEPYSQMEEVKKQLGDALSFSTSEKESLNIQHQETIAALKNAHRDEMAAASEEASSRSTRVLEDALAGKAEAVEEAEKKHASLAQMLKEQHDAHVKIQLARMQEEHQRESDSTKQEIRHITSKSQEMEAELKEVRKQLSDATRAHQAMLEEVTQQEKELIAEMELLPQERCTISPNSETLLRKVTQALEREAPVAQLDEACYTDQLPPAHEVELDQPQSNHLSFDSASLTRLETELAALRADLSTAQSDLSRSKATQQELQDELSSTQSALSQAEAAMRQDKVDVQAAIPDFAISAKNEELSSAEASSDAVRMTLDKLETQMSATTSALEKSKLDKESVEEEMQELHLANTKKLSDMEARFKRDVRDLQEQNLKLQNELAARS
ncbi:MAG: hypothetical protein CYPHOPRED_002694 [Cyphobasidiales sp. Tagirdzhanova-0007]|nr:MAG: hypothetical protein CYPHOPRED_002694 [Cyphobasidiales sp. Tagirdzhanova-0007]